MKIRFTLLITLLLWTTMAWAQSGQTLDINFVHNDSLRTFLLYVPEAYDGSEDWPLVINYHGYTSSAEEQVAISKMNLVADTANFLVAYPQGLLFDHVVFGPGSGWNWNPEAMRSVNDDVDFTSKVIDQVFTEYAVDPSRVYTTGFSMGSLMAFQAACELPDRIAAVAGVSNPMGSTQIANCNPGRPVPSLLIHGTADPQVPFEGIGPIASAPATISFWANQNNCSLDSSVTELADVVTTDNSTVTLIEYMDCDAGTEVMFYRINNGGHAWPGGISLPSSFGAVNRDINASSEIWNFFNRQVHPDPAGVPQLLEKTIMVDTLEREYLLYVPADYDGSEAWPLVFNLHGATSNAREQLFVSGMNKVADTAHFLVVYPEGISNRLGDSGWNEPNSPDLQDDVQFVSDMIDAIAAEYQVDLSRVYSTGLSNGGGMSFTLARTLSDRIAAVASVAAPGLLEEPIPERPVPILYMHGTADQLVPFEGGMGLFPIDFPAARDRVQFWVDNNGCSGDPEIIEFPDVNTADSSTVTLERYTDCEASSEIAFYVIDNGGHTWPGGPPVPPGLEILGNVNLDINASSEIWNFFNRFTLQTTSLPTLSPSELDLQVFPNPFSTQLTFTFELPEAARVQLSIFNQLGQEVQTLVDQRMPKGEQRVEWNAAARQLSEGLYYYRLRVGDRFVSRAVVSVNR